MDCIFCKIIKKEVPADIVYEDEKIIAFKDIKPMAPVHILIIPKKHIPAITDIKEEDVELMGRLIFVAKKIADDLTISKQGYKLLFRVKEHGGQEVNHIHLHLIGGAPLFEDIHPI
ncbi:histidine triad nucleotide-binding protein [bacterium]|nr:histidine triad nucleotide-binding protein [bacterium]